MKNTTFDPKMRSKIGPRSPQDRLKIVLKIDRCSRRFFDRFLVVLGSFWLPILGPFSTPKRPPHPASRHRFHISRPIPPQDGPKRRPRPPKTPSGLPKATKNRPKTPPKRPKIDPRHERQKTTTQHNTTQQHNTGQHNTPLLYTTLGGSYSTGASWSDLGGS